MDTMLRPGEYGSLRWPCDMLNSSQTLHLNRLKISTLFPLGLDSRIFHENTTDAGYAHEDRSYYLPPFDYADNLKHVSVRVTYMKIEEQEADMTASPKEAESAPSISAHRQYEYCHLKNADEEERRQRLAELQLLQITYNKLRRAAEPLQSRLISWRMSLQHKAIWDNPTWVRSSVAAWLPRTTCDCKSHNPALPIQDLERTQAALDAEIKRERLVVLEDGRSLLRVADTLVWEFEKMKNAARERSMLHLERLIATQKNSRRLKWSVQLLPSRRVRVWSLVNYNTRLIYNNAEWTSN